MAKRWRFQKIGNDTVCGSSARTLSMVKKMIEHRGLEVHRQIKVAAGDYRIECKDGKEFIVKLDLDYVPFWKGRI